MRHTIVADKPAWVASSRWSMPVAERASLIRLPSAAATDSFDGAIESWWRLSLRSGPPAAISWLIRSRDIHPVKLKWSQGQRITRTALVRFHAVNVARAVRKAVGARSRFKRRPFRAGRAEAPAANALGLKGPAGLGGRVSATA